MVEAWVWADRSFLMWMLLSVAFFLLGWITLAAFVHVRGLRGVALATDSLCLGLLTLLLAILRVRELGVDIRLPMVVIYVGIQVSFVLLVLSQAVLVDLWLGEHNDHKTVTTKTYQWWKEKVQERKLRKEEKLEGEV